MPLLEKLTAIINERFTNWQFVGSIVDWYYFDGQIWVKDFDIVTSDPFEPTYVSPIFGPRYSFRSLGRAVDVFAGEPTGWIETPDERVAKLHWLMDLYPSKREKYERLISAYGRLGKVVAPQSTTKTCPHRGPQLRTMTSDLCGTRGHAIPVYSCEIHGECTHRQACRGQDSSVVICIGCENGPWPPN